MNDPMNVLRADLATGVTILLDGPVGSELEMRGARMHEFGWSATASETDAEILQSIYLDYMAAGARIITTNTFSSNRIMLRPAGLEHRFESLNTQAIRIACRARDAAPQARRVAVAGAMSHQMPRYHGRTSPQWVPTHAQARASFREMAALLAAGGVDVIVLEMMSDPDYANLAIEAAKRTGLPVWVGFSVRRDEAGHLVSNARREMPMEQMFREIALEGVEVAGVMHSSANDIGPALVELRRTWEGPTMAYPDSGFFRLPNWVFENILPEDEFVAYARAWIDSGTQLIGSCCGLGLAHFRALAAHLNATTS